MTRSRSSALSVLRSLGTAAAIAAALAACGQRPAPATDGAPSTPATNSAAAARPELQKLQGQWQRADGDYTIEIKGADASGNLEAAYFNPSPIRVSRAVAVSDSEGVKVVMELNDVNYPGCVYRLTYDRQVDQLFGTYYQAALDETFNVTFARAK